MAATTSMARTLVRRSLLAGLGCVAVIAPWLGCSSTSPAASVDAGASSEPPPAASPPPTAPPPGAPPSTTPQPCHQMPRTSLPIDWSHNRVKPLAHRLSPERMRIVDACPPGSDAGPAPDDAAAPPVLPPTDSGPDAASDTDAGLDAEPGSDSGLDPGADAAADGSTPLDWNFPTAGPVNAAAAMVIPNFPSPSPGDAIYFGAASGSPNFFKLTGIYGVVEPAIAWEATTGGLDGSAVALSADSSLVYAVDKTGALYCFVGATGGVCPGWPAQFVATSSPVSLSSPWIDYATGALYFGDLAGGIHKMDTATGASVWTYGLGASAIHSSPIEMDGYVYVGDDAGNMYRVLDPGASAPTAGNVSSVSDCAPSCSSNSPIAGPTADIALGKVYFAGNGSLFELPMGAGTWAPTASLSLNMPPAVNGSGPIVDGAGNLYVGFANAVFRVAYPLAATSPPVGALLYGQAPGSIDEPLSTPLVWNGYVYIGDGAGMTESYTCLARSSAPALDAITPVYGAKVDSEPLIDYGTGNVIFGYSSPGGGGGLVQIVQGGGWGCGTQSACATASCGTGSVCAPAMGCVPDLVPPSTVWLSGGGGTGAATGGSTAAVSIGGLGAGGIATSGSGATVWFGELADETF